MSAGSRKDELRAKGRKLLVDLLQDYGLLNLFAPSEGFAFFVNELYRRAQIVHPKEDFATIAKEGFSLLNTVEHNKFGQLDERTLDRFIEELSAYVEKIRTQKPQNEQEQRKRSNDFNYYRGVRNVLNAMKSNIFTEKKHQSSTSSQASRSSASGRSVRFDLGERSPGPAYSGELLRAQFQEAIRNEDLRAINALSQQIVNLDE